MQPALQRQATSRPVVLIPAYQPSPVLPEMVRELAASGEVEAVVVVDDGSGPEYGPIFQAAAAVEGATLLRHVVNLGKGAALKTGLNAAACRFPGHVGVVTADADGQHKVSDILRTARALADNPARLVLGVRDFRGEVPLRSRIGNGVTRAVMRFVTGQSLSDTQTGLRGIPMSFVPDLMRTKPNGYDFELDMLLTWGGTRREIAEISIETVYIDQNRSSHFNPLLDSMRVYFVFLRFAAVSMITAGIDNTVFLLLHHSWPSVIGCQFASRAVAGVFNYSANKLEVFRSRTQNTVALPRYCLSVVAQGLVSYFLFTNLSRLLGIDVVIAKILVETALFFASFVVQREFVFRGSKAARRDGSSKTNS
jgi:putative flippase GtrA